MVKTVMLDSRLYIGLGLLSGVAGQEQWHRYILSPRPVTLTLLRSSVGATPTLKGLLGM